MARDRSLFWRTLQVAGKDALFAAALIILSIIIVGIGGWIARAVPYAGVVLRWAAIAGLAFLAFLLALDIRDWWSRCRARAQGAE